ncbi:DNA repair protein RecN [Clostridium fermenticellae]|uniref:DNA repair protein RecN n=1 Tax=Clostridium fermenticellae TaxID=2068654 RepID=A0A386H4M5_9CLOT|nr:DNA repair protein RecN [Clostridium fermenticellae]AYD40584.1 DNA repair protein RecN [Clostridium fermenticellae]
MLLQLNIKNFALIEELTISFNSGFNVLAGETGAGKSILIDAINYVLGSKFNKELIRTGENKTFVEAVFTVENPKTSDILEKNEIEIEDIIIISRETFQSGKSIAKVNGKSVLLSTLRFISSTLIDIHGQHENQNLLLSENHINYIDDFGNNNLKMYLNKYKEIYHEFIEKQNDIKRLTGNNEERNKIIDFLKYQIDEINSANLKEGEDIKLNEKYKILSNSEKISRTLNDCYVDLYEGRENVESMYDKLRIMIKHLDNLEQDFPKVIDIVKALKDAYYNMEDAIEKMGNIKNDVYYDESELEYINGRMYQINDYKKKYGDTIPKIFEYRDKISKQYYEMVNSNEIIENLKDEMVKIVEGLKNYGKYIHIERCKIADILEKNVKKELNFVGLEKSVFKVDVSISEKFYTNGMDSIRFLISTNPGEPLKPLEKIVSGGELSRIMLALKTVFVDKDKIPSVIFDEIDTGISGRIAQCVAEKMYTISKKHQVLCVTHLPQIACMSDEYYLVSKEVKDNKTFTHVKKLKDNQKEYEIAKMIGGSEVTKLTLEHSKELIRMADIRKINIKSK